MKSIEKTNTSESEKKKMTLRDYYRRLPEANLIAPRKALIKKISEKCDVSESTARSWVAYGVKPRNEEYIKILSEETGIPMEDLWEY